MMLNISKIRQIKNSEVKIYFMIPLVRLERKLMLQQEKENSFYPAITAKSNNATIFVILIIGFTAGPAVSL